MQLHQKPSASDAELLERAKLNPDDFGLLMQLYEQPLFHYIRRISQLPKEDIEDLLQEIFIKIYRKLNEYPPVIKFSSWIYRIAHNHLIDHFRKLNAQPKIANMPDEDWLNIVASEVNVEKELIHRDCAEKIKKCISDLPLQYRVALMLRYIEQKDYEEIMDILQKPKGSVSTLVSRGKTLLRKKLREQHIDCF